MSTSGMIRSRILNADLAADALVILIADMRRLREADMCRSDIERRVSNRRNCEGEKGMGQA